MQQRCGPVRCVRRDAGEVAFHCIDQTDAGRSVAAIAPLMRQGS